MSQSTLLPRPALIVFDADGTLVDVARSYREAAPIAAGIYLRLLGLTPPPLTGDLYDTFKRMTGFNDDWDLTAGLLHVLLAGLPPALPRQVGDSASDHSGVPNLFGRPEGEPGLDQDTLLVALQSACGPIAGATPPLPDWEALVMAVRSAGGGLAGLARVTPTHNAHLVWRSGDAATTDLVQRIFSEVYLGADLFAEGYGYPARFWPGPGLIETETLLIGRETLAALRRFARLGIATGRTRFELAHPLRRFELAPFFGATATMTDALEAPGGASLLKPHPFLLQRAADALDPTGRLPAAYVGDAPDDIMAARRADAAGGRRWRAIGIATTPAQAEHYTRLGADRIIAHPDELTRMMNDE
jgi:phosphoglycolate phosphatase-like HAD superfamily hydrolase